MEDSIAIINKWRIQYAMEDSIAINPYGLTINPFNSHNFRHYGLQ